MGPHPFSHFYKREVLSDVRIAIWNMDQIPAELPEPPCGDVGDQSPNNKRQKTDSCLTFKENGSKLTSRGVLVEELPGHKAAFYAASPYFRAMIERWKEPEVITFEVKEEEISAAQALVYFVYHGCLPEGEDMWKKVHKMYCLADQYDMVDCIQACVQLLQLQLESGAEQEGGNLAAVALEAIAVLAVKLGSVADEAADSLLGSFNNNRKTLHKTFAESFSKESDEHFPRAVEVLFAMFHDMDKVWVQDKYRSILHLFPAAVIEALLQRDDLECMSENVIATAITEWVEAQAQFTSCLNIDAEERLLYLIRMPFLTTSYRTRVLPTLRWIVKRHYLAAHLVLLFGHAAASSSACGGGKQSKDSPHCPARCKRFTIPRKYTPEWQTLEHAIGFKWIDIKAATQHKLYMKENLVVRSAAVWFNGLCVNVVLELQPDKAASTGKRPGASLSVHWFWRGPVLETVERHTLGPEIILATCGEISVWNEDSTSKNNKRSEIVPGASATCSKIMCVVPYSRCHAKTCVYERLPAEMDQYAKEGWSLNVKLNLKKLV